MGQVTLRINGYAHALACADGEEEHLRAMGAEIDQRIATLRQAGLAGGEARMLVVAALQLADELADANKRAEAAASSPDKPAPADPGPHQSELALSVAELAGRVGRVAERLERAGAPAASDTAGLETASESA